MKTFILRTILIITLFFTIIDVYSQPTPTDSLYRKVEAFGQALPQEKVYLHLDNTCYFLGDTIWYKGYVTQSNTGTLTSLSRILYVELLTPDGYLVERQQLEMPDGMAHGMFVLTDSLYAGYYELRAYTRWMLNFELCEYPHVKNTEDNFYSKKMAKEFFRDYEKLYSRVFPVFDKPEVAGEYLKDMTLRPMRRYYKKPREQKPELDLRFYPEGGNLVEGTTARVALELNDEDGQHLKGMLLSIENKDGVEVAQCKTDERGRAVFTLPEVAEKKGYRAVFTYEGYNFREELPEVEPEGCALAVAQDDSAVVARVQVVNADGPLALHVMSQGVSRFYRPLNGEAVVSIPLDSLPTGVNQLTVFNAEGRIYADRLFFVNHHDYDAPRLAVSGIRTQYEPFDSITLRLQLTDPTDSVAGLSLSVRDRATEEFSYDNGTMLTEMLLASEIRGFVENPGYYFEADDSIRRQALDLLLMVQGWRRYDWKTLAGTDTIAMRYLPEKSQTLAGEVHPVYSLYEDQDFGKEVLIPAIDPSPIEFYTTAYEYPNFRKLFTLQDLYGHGISKLKKEVNVIASYVQSPYTLDVMQVTENGTFYMDMPKVYEDYILSLFASDKKDPVADYNEQRKEGYMDETEYPNYYVKLHYFHPVFPKPYTFYQDHWRQDPYGLAPEGMPEADRQLPTVTVRNRRNGLRKLDNSKPAFVIDAYEAHNLTTDYGLNGGMFDWRTFSAQLATALLGDMGMERHFFLQERFDGTPLRLKINETAGKRDFKASGYSISPKVLNKYKQLRYLDKIYIYTDYAPREQGSWKYKQDNQPEVIIDYRLLPDGTYQHSYRDRHYVLRGYAVCDDFYSPDYSQRPLPDTKDYRRTLLWMPDVKFDKEGKATVRLYNNSKQTAISIEAEGITRSGKPIVWKKQD